MRVTASDRDRAGATPWFVGAESMLAGAGAGIVSSVVTCPLDVIKTKLQAGGGGHEARAVTLVASIWARDGVRGLYRGLGPTIFGYLPTWAIYFTVYDKVKMSVGRRRGHDDPFTHIAAAMTAGAIGTIVTNPLWVIKTRFMTQQTSPGEQRYRHTLDAIRTIYKTEGLVSFYRGLVPSLMGVSHIALQFPLYEQLKVYNRPSDGSEIAASTILFCSSASKMVASIATYPHEVLRTRLQIQKKQAAAFNSSNPPPTAPSSRTSRPTVRHPPFLFEGVVQTCRRILRDEGYRGLYRGMGVNLLRTVPASALTILTYEVMMRRLLSLSHQRV